MSLVAETNPTTPADIQPVPINSSRSDNMVEDESEIDEAELDMKQLLPIYINQRPIQNTFRWNDVGDYIGISLHSNFIIATSYHVPYKDYCSVHSSTWAIEKNDIEIFKLSLILDKQKEANLLLEYCYDRNVLELDVSKIKYEFGALAPLPHQETIHLPHVYDIVVDTGVKNKFIDSIDGKKRIEIISIKLCDVRNNSKYGPMLMVEVGDIKNEQKKVYCKRIDSYKDEDTQLLQVRVTENEAIMLSFPNVTALKNKENEETSLGRKRRRTNKCLFIYGLIFFAGLGYLLHYFMFTDEKILTL